MKGETVRRFCSRDLAEVDSREARGVVRVGLRGLNGGATQLGFHSDQSDLTRYGHVYRFGQGYGRQWGFSHALVLL